MKDAKLSKFYFTTILIQSTILRILEYLKLYWRSIVVAGNATSIRDTTFARTLYTFLCSV